jgi:hypothetical protein
MSLRKEIEKRAHAIEPQGDGIEMVLIRMDEILAAARAYQRKKTKRPKKPRGKIS